MISTGFSRFLLFLHSLLGTTSVSKDTLQRSKLKTFYSLVLTAAYLYETYVLSFSFSGQADRPEFDEMVVRFMEVASALYLLARSIFYYRTLPSAVLSLQWANEQMETNQINIKKHKNIHKTVLFHYCFTKLFVVLAFEIRAKFWPLESDRFSIETHLGSVHSSFVQLLGAVTYWILMAKSIQLNQTLFEEANNVGTTRRERLWLRYPRRTDATWSTTEGYIKLTKKLRGTVEHVIWETQNYFWFDMILTLVLFTFEAPQAIYDVMFPEFKRKRLHQTVVATMSTVYLLLTAVGCLTSVVLSEMNKAEHSKLISMHQAICLNVEDTNVRKELKRQMLAGIHGSHLLSCHMVDLDYGLIQDLIDTSILIFSVFSALD